MRNEELGMVVAASPQIFMGRCPKVAFKETLIKSDSAIESAFL